MPRLRHILISGAFEYRWREPWWTTMRVSILEHFPRSQLAIESRAYFPHRVVRIRRFAREILARHDSEGEIILWGHSMGGDIACAIAHRFEKATPIAIVTIFSPHEFCGGALRRITGAQTRLNRPIPLFSFEAQGDRLVTHGTRHPDAQQHRVIPQADHRHALRTSRRVCDLIVETVHEHVTRPLT